MNTKFLTALAIIFVIALGVRVTSLGAIDQVVFDEVHFGKFISSYCCTHERFFDIHPPIGKLLIAGGAYLAGYDGQFSFDHIGQKYENIPITGIRFLPAFVGSLLPVVLMVLLHQAGVSLLFVLVGGVAGALENALIVESRFILIDSILLTATFGCVAAAIAAVQTKKSAASWMYICIAGVLAGVAVGTKFTGAIGGGLAVSIFGVQAIREMRNVYSWIGKIVVCALIVTCTYLFGWFLHFSLLTLPGSGDVWGVPSGYFWQDLVHVHQQMLSANYNLTADHPYGSKWYTWPMMLRSVFYWQGEGDRFVYLLGNPVVWWGSTVLLGAGIIYLFGLIVRGKIMRVYPSMWIFLFGFLASFIPLTRVPRVLFLYHYLTPLVFSLLFGLWWLDRITAQKNRVVVCATLLIVFGAVYISPLTYGFRVADTWRYVLFSVSSWR